MSGMSKKHFIALADAIKRMPLKCPEDRATVASSIAAVCRAHNYSFDCGRFLRASTELGTATLAKGRGYRALQLRKYGENDSGVKMVSTIAEAKRFCELNNYKFVS